MPDTGLANRVEAVAGVPLPNGLLSLPSVVPMSNLHEQMGIDWQPSSCGTASTTGWCPPEPDDPDLEKIFNTIGAKNAVPVTAYAGVDCSAVGWTFTEGITRVKSILSIGEQAALEAWAWDNLIASGTDVSGDAGDMSVVGRLGVLEAALATVYAGVGVVHVPVVFSSYMQSSGLIIQQGSRLRTRTGHDVVIGAGYPSADDKLAITGPVQVHQGGVATVPRNDQEAVNMVNDRKVLAERTSVILIECGAFVTSVERTCCGITGS